MAIGADLPVAMGCCATCGVDRMGAAEVDELISMFKKFDRNGDGSIDGSELKALLHVSGADASDAQVATMLADNDTDGDGVISFSEFVGIVRAGEASEAAHAGAAGGGRGAAGGCVESSVTVSGNTLSCSHYVQLGYTCEVSACRPAPACLRRGTPDLLIPAGPRCSRRPRSSCPSSTATAPAQAQARQCRRHPAPNSATPTRWPEPAVRSPAPCLPFPSLPIPYPWLIGWHAADPSIMTADHLCGSSLPNFFEKLIY